MTRCIYHMRKVCFPKYSRKRENQCQSRATAEISGGKETENGADRGESVVCGCYLFGCEVQNLFWAFIFLRSAKTTMAGQGSRAKKEELEK